MNSKKEYMFCANQEILQSRNCIEHSQNQEIVVQSREHIKSAKLTHGLNLSIVLHREKMATKPARPQHKGRARRQRKDYE